jgi:hypothetical protein
MALAAPERSYLLTLAGESFATVRNRVKDFRWRLRKTSGRAWEDCWHVEPNPALLGEHHVHGLQHGEFIPVETFRRAATYAGFGSWVGLRKVRNQAAASLYGVKLAALAASAYSLKGVGQDLEQFLAANGGRMVHASRGFWRDAGGAALPGVDAARAIGTQRLLDRDLCPGTGERHDWAGIWEPGFLARGGPSGVPGEGRGSEA